jgi:hypothetical protein
MVPVIKGSMSGINITDWTRYLLCKAITLLCIGTLGCTTIQVDTAPVDRFANKGFQSFSWRAEVPTGVPQSMEKLYQLSTTVREVLSASLKKKGYRYQTSGGDFLVSYAFSARLEGGINPEMLNPAPTSSVINRSPDPAIVNNAYALSGPREVASLMLSFEDGDNLAAVWSANISQVVENQNQPHLDKIRRNLEPGIARALRVLPDATKR